MKKIYLFTICSLLACLSFAQNKGALAIIPEPVSIITRDGEFTLPKHVLIEAGSQADVRLVSAYLRNKLAASTGFPVTVKNAFSVPATIKLVLKTKTDTVLGKEGYQLWVGKKRILIEANDAAGLFYGVQTLVQLFPKEIESKEVVPDFSWTAPSVDIKDYPRFCMAGTNAGCFQALFYKRRS